MKRGNPEISALGEATRFKPGQSGNPAGRPSLKPITDALREVLDETDPKTLERRAKVIARKLVMKAQNGDLATASFVTERTEGKAVQPIIGRNDEPLLTGLDHLDAKQRLIAVTQRLRARIAERSAKAGSNVPE